MNKKTGIIVGIVAVMVIMVSIFFTSNNLGSDKKGDKAKDVEIITPEILDDNVVLDENIKSWVEKSKQKEGFYTKTTDEATFVLMSGGKKETTGYGISLNAVDQKGYSVVVKYEVLAPLEGFEVKKEKTTPNMLLRFASTDLKIKGEVSELENTEPKKESAEKAEKIEK